LTVTDANRRAKSTNRFGVGIALTVALLLAGCASTTKSATRVAATTPTTVTAAPTSLTTAEAPTTVAALALPAAPAGVPVQNHTLTPGDVFPGVTAAQVCVPGYSASVRAVSFAEKTAVFAEYRTFDTPGAYEVDHLISLELGGSNNITNLWPEPYAGPNGARAKDKVENSLHADVCAGRLTLQAAQTKIAADWWNAVAAANPTYSPPATTAETASAAAPSTTPAAASGIVCKDGYQWPGTTRQGACHGHGGIR
jgi:hypothetical protein